MKKVYLFLVMVLMCSMVSAQTDVPNGNLEAWYFVTNPVNPGTDYWDAGAGPNDNWLTTLNELALIPPPMGPGPITAERTEDKHSGTYAAKLTSKIMPLGLINVFIPGMLGTEKMDNANVRAILGRPNTSKPLAMNGWYKYEPVNGDSCTALLLVSKWNSTSNKRDTIGYGQFVSTAAVNAYTQFTVPVSYNYPAGQETPDTMTLLVITSAGFSVLNFMNCVGQVGSTMYVDDLTLSYPNGIEEHLMSDLNISVYPNPASNNITFSANKNAENSLVTIYSPAGAVVEKFNFAGREVTRSVNGLAAGIYRFSVSEGKRITASGSFTVVK